MQKKKFKLLGRLIFIYALLVFFGGGMGFLLKKSFPSLISGSFFAFLLFLSGIQTTLCRRIGPIFNLFLLTILFLFFSYRFFVTKAWLPAGMMVCLTGFMMTIQLICFQKMQRIPSIKHKK